MLIIELTDREMRGTRAAVLEAVTDQIFDSEPDLLARSDLLLSEWSADARTADPESKTPRVVQVDEVTLEAVSRSLAHAAASIEEWELPIRIGLTRDQLDLLDARIAARRGGTH